MTALEILKKGGDFSQYRKPLSEFFIDEKELRDAREVAACAAAILKTKFHARRVVLFGSLARSGFFDRTSDIDLMAWGIPRELFLKAVSALLDLKTSWPVNLELGESAGSRLATEVERDGVDL